MPDLDKALLSEPQGASLLTSLAAGTVVWLLTLSLGVGFAAFAFNAAPELVTEGIAMQVLGSGVVYIVSGLGSQAKELFWQASPIPSLYYGAFIKIGVENCTGDLTSTIQVFIMMSTFVFGLALLACAKFQAGKVMELFPDAVLTGYIGGIGTLIIRSALTLLSGTDPLVDIDEFCKTQSLVHVAVGIVIGVVTFVLMRKFPHPATMVLPIFVTIALFYITILILGIPLQTTRDSGWVFQNFGSFAFQRVWTGLKLNSVDFPLIGQEGVSLILHMVLLSAVAQYSSSGAVLSEFTGSTAGVDHGTQTLGIANVIVGGLSGMASAGGMAPSAVAAAILGEGNSNRWPHIFCGCLHLTLFLSGFPLVAYLPKCALAGCLLIPIGIKMMWGALLGSLYCFGLGDYLCIVMVSATTIFSDVQTALYVGFVFNSFLMIFNYARKNDIVYERSSLETFRSLKDRSIEQRQFIEGNGKQALIWRLHGVLFLGNSIALKRELTSLLEGACEAKVLVLDFARVSYVEHSVWAVFFQLADKAKRSGKVNLWACGLSVQLKRQLAQCGDAGLKLNLFRSLALALEVAEDEILKCAPPQKRITTHEGGQSQLSYIKLSSSLASMKAGSKKVWDSGQLSTFFEESKYKSGDAVCSEGSFADHIYFVDSGEFHMYQKVDSPSQSDLNLLRKMTRGYMFGSESLLEMSEYRASVACKFKGLLLKLSKDAFRRMMSSEPQMALDLMLLVAFNRSSLCWELLEHSFTPDRVINGIASLRQSRPTRRFTNLADESATLRSYLSEENSPSRIRIFFAGLGESVLGWARKPAFKSSPDDDLDDLDEDEQPCIKMAEMSFQDEARPMSQEEARSHSKRRTSMQMMHVDSLAIQSSWSVT